MYLICTKIQNIESLIRMELTYGKIYGMIVLEEDLKVSPIMKPKNKIKAKNSKITIF